MSEHKTNSDICFIGGDRRQLYAAIALSDMIESKIFVSGETFETLRKNCNRSNIYYEENPLKAIHASSAVILPLPAARAEKEVSFIDVVAEMKRNNGVILGGMMPPYMLDILDEENVTYADYYSDECFTVTNAYITAEGAIALAMEHLETMLRDTKCAILGFGRIGKALGSLLLSIGCRPAVYARRDEIRTLAREMGMETMSTPELSAFDVVFNTVPQRIINNDMLLELPSGRILIELASAPGGFDPEIAQQCSHTVVDGKGLPGRYAPVNAGRAVADTVYSILSNIKRRK